MGEHALISIDTVPRGVEQLTREFTYFGSQGGTHAKRLMQACHISSYGESNRCNFFLVTLSNLYPKRQNQLKQTKYSYDSLELIKDLDEGKSKGYHACKDSGRLGHRIQ